MKLDQVRPWQKQVQPGTDKKLGAEKTHYEKFPNDPVICFSATWDLGSNCGKRTNPSLMNGKQIQVVSTIINIEANHSGPLVFSFLCWG